MFTNPGDRGAVEASLVALRVHPEEVARIADLGDVPETAGQEIIAALPGIRPVFWYIQDMDDPRFLVTNIRHAPALDMERKAALGIGAGGPSQYERLLVGCTDVDAVNDPDVVHVNTTPEYMRFQASGPRILIDGKSLPLPDSCFRRGEGSHIPFDRALTPALLAELHRTLRSGGLLVYAPSTNVQDVVLLLQGAGFVSVVIAGFAPRTIYRGRMTPPTLIIEATKP